MNPLFNICSEFLIDRIIMADTRKKASMSQVLVDIKPYITKKFMAAPCIKEQDIQAICQILLPRYKNVQLMQGLTNNKPDFRIQVKGLLGTEEKRFEVVGGDKKRSAVRHRAGVPLANRNWTMPSKTCFL